MSSETTLVTLEASQIQQAGEMMARAFFDDALVLYMFPDEEQRRALLPLHFMPFIRYGVLFGEVVTTAGTPDAVAVWLPPDHTDMTPDKVEQAGLHQVSAHIGEEAWHRFETVNAYVEALHPSEAPEPHWYLGLIGVDSPRKGTGLGSTLLRHTHARADAQGLPSYLWTVVARNVTFYQRNGYRVLTEAVEPTSHIRFWTCRRDPLQ